MRFAEILGQDSAIGGLRQSIDSGRVSTAYLFCGAFGTGKRSLISAFAAALLCENYSAESGEACGACESCRLFANGSHPDYLELIPEKNDISVSEMREFCRECAMRPIRSSRRVCVIPEADRMNIQSANCFLKTLEEPPGSAVMLLRSENPEQLLLTIVSRCQAVRLRPLAEDQLRDALQKRTELSAEASAALARLSEGSLGRALELSGEQAAEDWAWIEKSFAHPVPGSALTLSDQLIERAVISGSTPDKNRVRELLDLLALYFRQFLRDNQRRRQSLYSLEKIWEAGERMERNVNPDLILRTLTLELTSK